MPSGKLKIEGTITIKHGKDKKKKRKAHKPKQKKDTTGYTGTGAAQTRQEFGQPYTAAAVMNAAMLRPMLQFQQPQIQPGQSSFEQKTIAPKEQYYQIEDIPYVPSESIIAITKREFMQKAEPFLKLETQERIQQYKQQSEEELRALQLRGEEQMNEYQAELTRQKNFFENEMEAQQASFRKELSDLAQQAEDEVKSQQLKSLSGNVAALAINQGLFNIVNDATRKQFEEEQQKSKELQKTLQITAEEAEIDKINAMQRTQLGKEIRKFIPNFNEVVDPDGNERTIEDLRLILLTKKGLNVQPAPRPTGRGRKTEKYQRAEMEAAEPPSTMEERKPKPYKAPFVPNEQYIAKIQQEMASQEDEIAKALAQQKKINKQNEMQQLQESSISLDSNLASRLSKKREEGKIEPAPSFEPTYGPEIEQSRVGGLLSRFFA